MEEIELDDVDRQIINQFQGGFELTARPYQAAADQLGISEANLISRIERLVACRALSRFGPMYNAEKLGGAVSLCALAVPEERYDEVTELVNSHHQVAHNYARTHALNMWFVVATERYKEIEETLGKIEDQTGLKVYNFPKSEEFFIGLKVPV